MKTISFSYPKVMTALAAALALLCGPGPCPASEYTRLADELAKTARTAGLNHMAVCDFTAQGQAGHGAARDAQQQLTKALFELPLISVMDASVLKNLKERGQLWAQVLVTGTVYKTETGTALVAKLTNPRSGAQILIRQIDIEGEARSPAPRDLRDAPRDTKTPVCVRLHERLEAANRAAVELKSRYWAAKTREPGLSYAKLTGAPGSELRKYATLQQFHKLLNSYYEQDAPVTLTKAERSSLRTLSKLEAAVLSACPEAR